MALPWKKPTPIRLNRDHYFTRHGLPASCGRVWGGKLPTF